MRFLMEHGLSLVLLIVYGLLQLAAWCLPEGTHLQSMCAGHADDTFGALLIVLATKWLTERDSAQSRPPQEGKHPKIRSHHGSFG